MAKSRGGGGADLTIAEVAAELGVSRQLVQQWIPLLPDSAKYRDGRRWLIRGDVVTQLADKNQREALTKRNTDRRKAQVFQAAAPLVERIEVLLGRISEQLAELIRLQRECLEQHEADGPRRPRPRES